MVAKPTFDLRPPLKVVPQKDPILVGAVARPFEANIFPTVDAVKATLHSF